MLKNEYLTKSIGSAIRVLSDLKHFGIKWQLDIDGRPIFQDVTKPIYFKHLKTLYLYDIRWDSFPAIPLEIDSIEDFRIITGSKRPENLVAFISKHASVIKGLFIDAIPMRLDFIAKSSLEYLEYKAYFSIDHALFYLNECKNLRTFSFSIRDISTLDTFPVRGQIEDDWEQIKYENKLVCFERKIERSAKKKRTCGRK